MITMTMKTTPMPATPCASAAPGGETTTAILRTAWAQGSDQPLPGGVAAADATRQGGTLPIGGSSARLRLGADVAPLGLGADPARFSPRPVRSALLRASVPTSDPVDVRSLMSLST